VISNVAVIGVPYSTSVSLSVTPGDRSMAAVVSLLRKPFPPVLCADPFFAFLKASVSNFLRPPPIPWRLRRLRRTGAGSSDDAEADAGTPPDC